MGATWGLYAIAHGMENGCGAKLHDNAQSMLWKKCVHVVHAWIVIPFAAWAPTTPMAHGRGVVDISPRGSLAIVKQVWVDCEVGGLARRMFLFYLESLCQDSISGAMWFEFSSRAEVSMARPEFANSAHDREQ